MEDLRVLTLTFLKLGDPGDPGSLPDDGDGGDAPPPPPAPTFGIPSMFMPRMLTLLLLGRLVSFPPPPTLPPPPPGRRGLRGWDNGEDREEALRGFEEELGPP